MRARGCPSTPMHSIAQLSAPSTPSPSRTWWGHASAFLLCLWVAVSPLVYKGYSKGYSSPLVYMRTSSGPPPPRPGSSPTPPGEVVLHPSPYPYLQLDAIPTLRYNPFLSAPHCLSQGSRRLSVRCVCTTLHSLEKIAACPIRHISGENHVSLALQQLHAHTRHVR